MKTNHCQKCPKYRVCVDVKECALMTAEMKRVEYGRAKGSIRLIYQSNMGRYELMRFDNIVYGAFDGD